MNTEGLTTAQIGGSARGYLAVGGQILLRDRGANDAPSKPRR
jgi:hypothetical protein